MKLFFSAAMKKNDSTSLELHNTRQPVACGGGIGRVRWRNAEGAVHQLIRYGFCIVEVDMQETINGVSI